MDRGMNARDGGQTVPPSLPIRVQTGQPPCGLWSMPARWEGAVESFPEAAPRPAPPTPHKNPLTLT